MKKSCFLLCLFLLALFDCQAEAKKDTTDIYLATIPADSVSITDLLDNSYNITNANNSVAKKYAARALELAKQINSSFLEMRSSFEYGSILMETNQYDSALVYFNRCVEISDSTGFTAGKFFAYNQMGSISDNIGKTQEAIEYYKEAKRVAIERGDRIGEGSVINNIAGIFKDQGRSEVATNMYRQALNLFLQENDSIDIANAYYNLGSMTDSMEYYNKALKIYMELDMISSQGDVYLNLCAIEVDDNNNYKKGIQYCKKALALYKKANTTYYEALVKLNLSSAFEGNEQLDSALHYAKSSFELNKKDKLYPEWFSSAKQLGKIFSKKNMMDSAYTYSIIALTLKDSLEEKELADKIAEYGADYELTKYEKDIADGELKIAKQKSQIYIISGIGIAAIALLLGYLFFIYTKRNLRKKELEILKKESDLQKIANDKLKDLDRMRSTFLANITHELKTPLTLILGPLEQAKKMAHGHALSKNITTAQNNGKKLLSLVNQILDLSKLQEGIMTENLEDTNIISRVKRIFMTHESNADLRKISMVFNSNIDDDKMIRIDTDKMEKILNNLVSNAIKFNVEKGTVKLDLELLDSENKLKINISDTGRGLSQLEKSKVFDRFYQAPEGERYEGGTGIGLTYTRDLVKFLKGSLDVKSTKGEGSVFSFCLPFKDSKTTNIEEIHIEEETNSYLTEYLPSEFLKEHQFSLLIVEDNPEMSLYLREILSKHFNCDTAGNGFQALESLGTGSFDLILSDVMMPDMDGFELKQRLNDNKDLNSVPFMFLTARSLEEDVLKGFSLGVDDYVTKPFSEAELVARIVNLLKNKVERDNYQPEDIQGEPTIESAEDKLIKEVEAIVLQNLDNVEFKIQDLSSTIGYSQRQLGRLIKQYTGLSSVNFILEIRLKKAYFLISSKKYRSVSEVRYEIGIESASYFTRKFTERFGINPKELLMSS